MRHFVHLVVITSLLAGPSWADVKVIRSTEMETMMGFGGGKKEMTVWTAVDRHREETKSEGKPSMMERMAGVGRPVITRLDKKLRWTLNEPKKNYQEQSLVSPVQDSKSSEETSES